MSSDAEAAGASHASNVDEVSAIGEDEQQQLHPLSYDWVWFFDKREGRKSTAEDWARTLKQIGEFATVEDFWRYYHNVCKPSMLDDACNFRIFKRDIQPAWEDAANAYGGEWTLSVMPTKVSPQTTDAYWEKLVLAVIGGAFEDGLGDEVTGIVYNRRRKRGDRISLWHRSGQPQKLLEEIRDRLALHMELPHEARLEYAAHSESMKSHEETINKRAAKRGQGKS